MPTRLDELLVENLALDRFAEAGLATARGVELGGASGDCPTILADRVKNAIRKLNPQLPESTVEGVSSLLARPPHPTLIENNRWFHGLLTDGAAVEYRDAKTGETRGGRARVIDFDDPTNNDFLVVRQLTIQGASGKKIRPDLLLYVNGLPLVAIELKDPTDASATLEKAIDQFGRYKQTSPDLFVPNLLLVASDGLLTRVGSITSGRQRFTPWRPASGGEPTLEALIRELLAPEALLDYLQSCVAFEEDEWGNIVKKVAGYHQFRAVRKARASVIAALTPALSQRERGADNATLRINNTFLPLPLGEGRGEGAGGPHARVPADILQFARELRRNQTDAEQLLWSILRGRRFGNFKFRRQHPLGRMILDFYCHEAKLSIELDGGQHNTEEGRRRDGARTQEITSQGIRELRFWNYEVLEETDAVLEAIWNALHEQSPHPGPLPGGEGGKAGAGVQRGEGVAGGAGVTGRGLGGVVWHTQGSGKSLTMLMLAGALVRAAELANPTLVIVTDRNDLDDQLFDTFAMGRGLLRQEPVQAGSREDLKKLLDRASGGVVFTTIHKFTESHGKISERSNVVVMADEAHRSQYGFIDGGARWMREALPNATFVGFTGTPLMAGDRVTRHVFGDYADVYDIRQAVADGATVPIYYEPRIVKLTIDEAGAKKAEEAIAEAARTDEAGEEAAENIRIPIEELYGAPERLTRVAKFLVENWEQRRSAMEGKAIVVTMSRDIAARLYEEIAKLRPGWANDDDDQGAMKVIMTGGLDDPEHIARHVRSKAQRKGLAARFKNPADDFRVAIVVDMWLTGFDVPCAHTMYLDKPLAGHNLMQAIARVNRVYGEKPGGLIVDLIGLADPLADALAMYANATGQSDKPIKDLQDEAIPAMRSAFEQLQGFFHGYDYSAAFDATPADVVRVSLGAVNHVLDVGQNVGEETGWKRFRGMVKRLSTAFALAVPREETMEITPHLAFFQRIAAMIRKRLADDAGPSAVGGGSPDIDAAVRQVIGDAVDAGEVIDLFAAAGLDAARLDILSEDFLHRVSALEQKNLALETLRKLLTDQIKISERTNLVQAQKFREALEKAMLGYTNKQITTAEMIAKLLELAKWVREAKQHGHDLGLSTEEVAFYDALAENGSAKDVMKSDELRLMARKLAEMVKEMPKLDWTQRESVRADLRRKVRRLLAMYGYPPDLSEDATQLVLKQAELSTEAGTAE